VDFYLLKATVQNFRKTNLIVSFRYCHHVHSTEVLFCKTGQIRGTLRNWCILV